MNQLYEMLLNENKYLSELDVMVNASLKKAPKGNLRISHHGKSAQYYYKSDKTREKLPQGRYIRKQELQLAKDLAQRDYDVSLSNLIRERIKAIEKLLELYKENKIQDAYEKLNPYRKEIVTPRILTDEEFAKAWIEKEYIKKEFREGTTAIYSNRGERVRSKSEKIIADMLDKYKMPYKYEAPLHLSGMGTIHPDFTILDVRKRKEIYWEHLGMMDNTEYCENALRRIEEYQRNGILLGDRLFITYETAKYPLETEAIERNILRILQPAQPVPAFLTGAHMTGAHMTDAHMTDVSQAGEGRVDGLLIS